MTSRETLFEMEVMSGSVEVMEVSGLPGVYEYGLWDKDGNYYSDRFDLNGSEENNLPSVETIDQLLDTWAALSMAELMEQLSIPVEVGE